MTYLFLSSLESKIVVTFQSEAVFVSVYIQTIRLLLVFQLIRRNWKSCHQTHTLELLNIEVSMILARFYIVFKIMLDCFGAE